MLYIASFGPACWIAARTGTDRGLFFRTIYRPAGWLSLDESLLGAALCAYAIVGMPKGNQILIPAERLPGQFVFLAIPP